jgi:hypothetical protein
MEFKQDIENDCGFHVVKKDEFCSPDTVVDKFKQLMQLEPSSTNILADLKKKYNCDNEICILNTGDAKTLIGHENVTKVINSYFKPTGPRDNNKWFSNTDIDSVLSQISKKYTDKHFYHVPFQMIDFEKTGGALAKLNWPEKYDAGYRCFGTVFNTDFSTGGGKHWFAIYCSFQDVDKEFTLEYFNSSGELPMNQINMWMKRVKHEWQPHFKKSINDTVVTRIVNQQDEWNCGSYSLYYIISRLDGVPYSHFKTHAIGDDNMQEFRQYLFRKA